MNFVSDRLANRLPFFYGYVMIPVAMLLQICTSPGQTFAVSAFTPALRESLSMSDSKLSFAYMLGTLLAAVPLSSVGPLTDRFGIRVVAFAVASALALTCLFASYIQGFLTLLLSFFLLRFLGQGSLSLLSGNTISMWFRSRLGRVSALMSVGGAVAFAFVPGWINESIEYRGWQSTYQWIAVVIVITMFPVLFLVYRNRPEDLGQHVDGFTKEHTKRLADSESYPPSLTLQDAFRHRSFYILCATNVFWAMAGTAVVFYLFTICQDRMLDDHVPSRLFQILGLSMLVAQLLGGVLSDKLPLHLLLGVGSTCVAIGLGFVWYGNTETKMQCFAATFGFGQGMLIAVGSVAWVRYYGRDFLGSIRGTAWACTVAGSGCGPLMMGVARDAYGVFDLAIGFFFFATLALSLTAWFATPPPLNKLAA